MEKLEAGAQKLGLSLTLKQLEQFSIYYRELADWNQRLNLTSITGCEEVQIKHFLDSLTVTLALEPPFDESSFRLIDIGTGAGLPGIPLKIILPAIKLVLLEATAKKADFLRHLKDRLGLAKKADFLRHLKDRLGLADVEVVVGRAEEVAHQAQYREKFDLVLSRAVASLPTLVELTLPFCAVEGSIIAQKKGDIEGEVRRADRAVGLLGGSLREVKSIDLEELSDRRFLVIIDKVQPTPANYPRRPGIPKKKPIV